MKIILVAGGRRVPRASAGRVFPTLALSTFELLEYSNCFVSHGAGGSSQNFTAHLVQARNVENSYLVISVFEQIFCEPKIQLDEKKKGKI